MKLNGWQRIWIVISCAWAGYWVYAFIVAMNRFGWTNDAPEAIGLFLAWTLIPPLLLYGAGLVVVWVLRGFRGA